MDKKYHLGFLALALFVLIGAGCSQAVNTTTEGDTNGGVETTTDSEMDGDMMDDEMSDDMDDEEMSDDMDDEDSDDDASASAGTYTAYSEAALAEADGDVVLFFKADWCSKCNKADEAFQDASADIPADLTIMTVDFDKATELKKQYGVTLQHTFVQVDSDGNEVNQWSGTLTLDELLEEVI